MEHIGACRLAVRGRSKLAKQAWEDGHIIAWNGIEIVDMEDRILERKLKQGIRECSNTRLARAVPPTNTNFRLTFLLTRLEEALYENLPV